VAEDGSPVAAASRSRSVSFVECSKSPCPLLGCSCQGFSVYPKGPEREKKKPFLARIVKI